MLDTEDLRSKGITHILSVMRDPPVEVGSTKGYTEYLQMVVDVEDWPDQVLPLVEPAPKMNRKLTQLLQELICHFDDTNTFISGAISTEGGVLVHWYGLSSPRVLCTRIVPDARCRALLLAVNKEPLGAPL